MAGVAAGVAMGIAADRLFGEPPAWVHPVAWFGRAAAWAERLCWADSVARGAGFTAAGVGGAAAAGLAARAVLRRAGIPAAAGAAAATWVVVAGRMLADVAGDVGAALSADDLSGARALLPALVGRDPAGLGAGEVARAAVESVAENTVDAVVAPALWALAGGAPGAFAYRAVNTFDSMFGHRNARYNRFGRASARLDDAAAWLPARLTAVLVAAVRPQAARRVWTSVRAGAPAHPSPNAGVAEAAFAGALGVRLGGANRYGERVEVRPPLGEGRPPRAGDIEAAIRLSRDVSVVLAALLAAAGAAGAAAGRARGRPGDGGQ